MRAVALSLVAGTIAATDVLRSRGRDRAARHRWGQSWPLLAGFIAGGLLGAAGAALVGERALVVPALMAIAVLMCAARTGEPVPPAS
ncbi:hypothetical protein M1L60_44755 [Actinoplanes sp. TRM 88003]|uniref:DUF1275 domain-containing protein n=1 Tax=Paractinoplanes aksuensis TaxID=2939490 RepID=A0ABT1E4A8_9ACTN|nr:hypothetical protein [Actinoplanes aksuensis]MCO8277708.1 hypothetical protein [Actinoplanes aksuensis]